MKRTPLALALLAILLIPKTVTKAQVETPMSASTIS